MYTEKLQMSPMQINIRRESTFKTRKIFESEKLNGRDTTRALDQFDGRNSDQSGNPYVDLHDAQECGTDRETLQG